MKSLKIKILSLGLVISFFSSCQKTGFTEMNSRLDGFGINPILPNPISSCANKDKDSAIISEDIVENNKPTNIYLHLYSCDEMNLKEIIWSSSGVIKYDNDIQTVQISFETLGAQEVQATIIYKDTVIDSRGQYVEGTKPKAVKKTIISI